MGDSATGKAEKGVPLDDAASAEVVKPCPFCGGKGVPKNRLRDGYEACPRDRDARAYWTACVSCAATGGWAKNERGAVRWWNMRTKP